MDSTPVSNSHSQERLATQLEIYEQIVALDSVLGTAAMKDPKLSLSVFRQNYNSYSCQR